MILIMDNDVQAVAEYMQMNLPANRLVEVSKSLALLAEPMWGHYERVVAPAVQLLPPQITSLQQSVASESNLVSTSAGDGSAVVVGARKSKPR